MKIVIDIKEETYTRLKNALIINAGNTFYNEILTSVAEGTPLPKGHGDLIDRDILLQNWKVIPSRDRLIFDRYIQTLDEVIPADKGE